jgi:hypothetical protein
MDFSSQELRFNDAIPQKSDFAKLSAQSFNYSTSDTAAFHTIQTELNDNYFWLSSSYGHNAPRPEVVVDRTDGSSRDNQRQIQEVEQTKQLFVLYKFADSVMYISDLQRKGFVSDVLKDKLQIQGTGVIVKNIFVDKDAFIAKIKSVDAIKFTSHERNLFSGAGLLDAALRDNFDMEQPESFSIWANYKTPINEKLKNTINALKKQKDDGHLKGLKIIGRDDQGIEQIFNEDTFTQKIHLSIKQNEQGFYDANEVKQKLLEKIGIIQ